MKKKIIFTGGTGRFANEFKRVKNNYKVFYPDKKELNILKMNSIINYIRKKKPKYFIHCAGLSRPMSIHENKLKKSIDLNLPHPKCHLRNFVLYPILQIDPNWSHPILKKNVQFLINKLSQKFRIEITRLNKNVNIQL